MIKKKILVMSAILLLGFLFLTPVFAETIVLKSGKTVKGKLIEKTDNYIKIDFQGAPLTYFFDEIVSIDGQKGVLKTKETEVVPIEKNKRKAKISDEVDPNKIFEKVIAAYKSLETYKAKGTITLDIDNGKMKMTMSTEFSILLKKSNLYLISWTQKNMSMPGMVQSGAVWSDGTQPYLYMGVMNAYSKMANDQFALGSATGISGGAAFTIPSIFLSVFREQPALFDRLINAKLEKVEQVENEECYVISGSSAISKKETFWISKTKYLIIKYYRSLEAPEGGITIPEMSDKRLEEEIKNMGQEATEENKQRKREAMKRFADVLKASKMKGSSTEHHVQISSPELSKADFHFSLPEGAVLKKSLFGGAFGGSK